MKSFGVINKIFFALLVGLGLLIATADHRELASINMTRPTTILSLVANRLHALQSYVSKLIDGETAGFRETVQKHESPKQSLER